MSIFRFFRRPKTPPQKVDPSLNFKDETPLVESSERTEFDVRRYFHNERGFQCYTSWFAHWDGWISAGHCVTEAHDHLPSFAQSETYSKWPDGLDAALVGCRLPEIRPADPIIGQEVELLGYPAGSRHLERRKGRVYFERNPGQWIMHILEPDEPVVTGMSGGPVLDTKTGRTLGITITRNSPADLNHDRDPDESADFIALSAVWDAMSNPASA